MRCSWGADIAAQSMACSGSPAWLAWWHGQKRALIQTSCQACIVMGSREIDSLICDAYSLERELQRECCG